MYMNSGALCRVILLVFPYLGLCELESTYVIELGCVVGVTHRQGPGYSADGAILKEDRSEEGSEEESEEEHKDLTLMVQVNAWPVQGAWTGKPNGEPVLSYNNYYISEGKVYSQNAYPMIISTVPSTPSCSDHYVLGLVQHTCTYVSMSESALASFPGLSCMRGEALYTICACTWTFWEFCVCAEISIWCFTPSLCHTMYIGVRMCTQCTRPGLLPFGRPRNKAHAAPESSHVIFPPCIRYSTPQKATQGGPAANAGCQLNILGCSFVYMYVVCMFEEGRWSYWRCKIYLPQCYYCVACNTIQCCTPVKVFKITDLPSHYV